MAADSSASVPAPTVPAPPRDAGARLSAIFHAAALGIGLLDLDGRFLDVNQALAALLGYEPGELAGRTFRELTHPDDREAEAPLAAELLAGARDRYTMEKRFVRRDGQAIVVRLVVSLVRGEDGRPLHTVKLVEDVTEQRREQRERDFLARASDVLSSSLDYGRTLDTVTRLAVEELADWCAVDERAADGSLRRIAVAHPDPARVALARELFRRYPPHPDEPHGVAAVLRTGQAELYPEIPDALLVASARDADHLRIARELGLRSAVVVPLVARGEVLGALTLVSAESGRRYGPRDLALARELARRAAVAIDNAHLYASAEQGRRRMEEQAAELELQAEELRVQAAQLEEAQLELEMSNDELQAANRELAARSREAEEANAAKSAFLATMSHELRTPLNAIGGYVELLELGIHGPVTEPQAEALERIRRSQQRLLGLINDVLNFARIEAGQVQFRPEPVPVDATLAGMQALIEPQVQAREVRYEYRGGDPSVHVLADRERLEQIVLNLLSNALKFTPAGGEIRLDWEAAGGVVRVHVRDTGCGIPPEKLEEVFEPFVQVDSSLTRGSEGTGLGLAISRDLARIMGGDLAARSEVDRGSVFTLTLPAARG